MPNLSPPPSRGSNRNANTYLLLAVFTGGVASLGVELAASRLLDPFFGNSIIIWANLIGLVLIYLTAGYYVGGKWADRDPRESTLYQIIGAAGLFIGVVPLVSRPLLRWSVSGFGTYDVGILAGSFFGVLLLFSVPVTLLGCVSPFAIRLAVRDVESSGNVAGSLYALSTLGSIIGTFLPVLVLIPNVGTSWTFTIFSAMLLVMATAGLLSLKSARTPIYGLFLVAVLAVGVLRNPGAIKASEGLVYEAESQYNYIQVLEFGGTYYLHLNEGQGVHSVYDPRSVLVYGVWDFFLVAPYFNEPPFAPDEVGSMMLLGSACGTIPRQYTHVYGAIPIEAVEIDPKIIAVGRRFFDMNQPNVEVITQDARFHAANSEKTYDVIGVDAYRPPYIPFHMTTVEFFTELREHLNENGVVAINAGRTSTDFSLVNALGSTMKRVFPNVYVIDVPDHGSRLGNSVVVGTREPTSIDNFAQNLAPLVEAGQRADAPESARLLADVAGRSLQARVWEIRGDEGAVFTDDKAPVEQVIHTLILHYVIGE